MCDKHRLAIKYVIFRLLPLFICLGLIFAFFVIAPSANGEAFAKALAIALCAVCFVVFLVFYTLNVCAFLRMIDRQEKQYGVSFELKNPKTLARLSSWIILGDEWLVRPGRCAIYRKDICSASVGDAVLDGRRGVFYPIKIKTLSNKTFTLKLLNENDARQVRKWAKKALGA